MATTAATQEPSMTGAKGDDEHDSHRAESESDQASTDDHGSHEKTSTALGKREKLMRHWKRFWWWYLIALIILLAILLPIFFKVIIAVIVQNVVSGQHIPINSGAIEAVSPTLVKVTLNTSLDTPLGVKIDPMDLNLYNKKNQTFSPFLQLNLPEQHVHHTTEVLVANQTVVVANETELLFWLNEYFDLPTVKLSVRAAPTVHLGALVYHPELEKTIEIASLNYLAGFGVQDMEFILPSDGSGHNMKGHLNIPNSGALTIGLGNLTFNLMSGKTRLGLVNIYDLELKPGNNTPPFDGEFFFDELVPNLATILDSQKEALGQGNIELNATGNSTMINGNHIKYLEGVLNTKHIRFQVLVITLLGDVLQGVLGGGKSSLLDIFGEAIGNTTMIGQLLDHWDDNSQNGDQSNTLAARQPKPKSCTFGNCWMWQLIKLGFKRKIYM